MKILQINKFYYLRGGAERYFFELKRLLEERGHEVIPFAMADPDNFSSAYSRYFVSRVDLSQPRFSFDGLVAAGRMIYSFEAKRKIEELIRATKPDLAHLHNIYHQISPAILPVLKKYQIPTVMTVHDFNLICPNYSLFAQGKICEHCLERKYFFRTIIDRCVKDSYVASAWAAMEWSIHHKLWRIYENQIDQFITPSEFLKNKLVGGGYDQTKIKVLPHFIDLEGIRPSFENKNYILSFGRLIDIKGIDLLITALKKNPEINLKIVGRGPAEKELRQEAKSLNLKKVEFLGFKSDAELNQLISEAKFVVVPSRAYETFGFSILESFARGKPVIASRLGSFTELINEGRTGLFFRPNDADDLASKIKLLFRDDARVKAWGREARLEVEKRYNKDRHYEEILKIYNQLLTKSKI